MEGERERGSYLKPVRRHIEVEDKQKEVPDHAPAAA